MVKKKKPQAGKARKFYGPCSICGDIFLLPYETDTICETCKGEYDGNNNMDKRGKV